MGRSPSFDAVPLKRWKFNRIWHLAPLPRRQIARQLDRAVADADQTADPGADRLEQAPHFAFATLSEHHPVPAVGAARGAPVRRCNALKRSAPIIELDASRQLLKILFFKNALNAHGVLPLDFVTRVHHAVGELAGIGQQQQTRPVDIQPLASRLSRRFRWRLVPARNRRLAARRRPPPDARAEGFWRFPLAAAAPPACAARDRRETCGWWRKAPAGPASRAGPRRRSSRGSPASG